MIDIYTNPEKTITEALKEAQKYSGEEITVHLAPGHYYEKVEVNQPCITFKGQSPKTTIIEYDDYALKMHEDGRKYGTFRSYTMFLDSHDCTLANLTVRNMCTTHKKAGQALALYADGNHIAVINCYLESYQDTLFTGPLPPFPYSIGGFTGPKEFSERINGYQYYKNCKISGDIDFIFGSATAYFDECDIIAKTDPESLNDALKADRTASYLTAASTAEGQEYGYVFNKCKLLSDLPEKTVYLGRPWRDFAKTVYIDCYMGAHIKDEGFHDWNKEKARDTILYAEYKSHGPGSLGKRASFCKTLTDLEATNYTIDKVIPDKANWTGLKNLHLQ